MRELVLTDDPVLVSFLESVLGEAGLDVVILDRNMSSLTGAAGRLPQRIMVAADEWDRARRVLVAAGLGQWVVDRDGG